MNSAGAVPAPASAWQPTALSARAHLTARSPPFSRQGLPLTFSSSPQLDNELRGQGLTLTSSKDLCERKWSVLKTKVMQTQGRKSLLVMIQPPRDDTVQRAVTATWFVLSHLDQVMPLCLDQVTCAPLLCKRMTPGSCGDSSAVLITSFPPDPRQSVQYFVRSSLEQCDGCLGLIIQQNFSVRITGG